MCQYITNHLLVRLMPNEVAIGLMNIGLMNIGLMNIGSTATRGYQLD